MERWGRGTQKIVELCVQAGHPEPEFVEEAGAVGVRFLPGGYIAPHRVSHDLSTREREILQMLAQTPTLAFRDLRAGLSSPPADRTLRDDLAHLKRLGLIASEGHGRGALWFLEEKREQQVTRIRRNRAVVPRPIYRLILGGTKRTDDQQRTQVGHHRLWPDELLVSQDDFAWSEEHEESGLSNADIRAITHLDREQVKRIVRELRAEKQVALVSRGRTAT